jgi:hypothetical protein
VNVVTPSPGTINDSNGSANRSICHNTASGNINSITGANADGLTIGYLWQRSLNAGGTWADVGASSVDYNPGTLTNTTYYRRGARINQSGCPVVYTQVPVIIEVFEPHQQGSITIQTPAVCPGTSGNKITGTAQTGGNPANSSYRWQSSTDGTSGWTNYPGTAKDLTLSHQTVTGFYRRADDAGCGTKYTNVVGAAVFADLTAGSIAGTQTVCQGTRPAILASSIAPGGGSGNFTYRWEKSNDGMTGWAAVSGAQEITYHPPVLEATTYFRRVVIDQCGELFTNHVAVTVSAAVNGGTILAQETEICHSADAGAVTNQAVATGGNGITLYSWHSSTNGSDYAAVPGATGLDYSPGGLTDRTYFRRRAENNCGAAYSNAIDIRVRPVLVAGEIENSQDICYDSNAGQLKFKTGQAPGGGFGSYTFQWQSSGTESSSDFGDISGAEKATYTPLGLKNTTWYRVVVSDSQCGNSTTGAIAINVFEQVKPGTVESSQIICYNTSPDELAEKTQAEGGYGAFTYHWQHKVAASETWTNIFEATGKTYRPPALSQSMQYRRVAANAGCGSAASNTVDITVLDPVAAGEIETEKQQICHGTSPGTLLSKQSASGADGQFSYQWMQRPATGGEWSDITGAGVTMYTPPGLTQSMQYKRMATNTRCGSASSNVLTITVSSPLSGGLIEPTRENVNYGEDPGMIMTAENASGGMGQHAYQWQNSANNAHWIDIAGATAINYPPGVMTQSMYFRRTVTDQCTTMAGNVVFIRVTGQLKPPEIAESQKVCFGENSQEITVKTNPNGEAGSYSYQWQRSDNNSEWFNMANATSTSHMALNIEQNQYFRLRLRDQYGQETFSNSVLISPYEKLDPGQTGQAQGSVICYGERPGIISEITSASGGYGSHAFKWEYRTGTSQNWLQVQGANGNNYIPGELYETTYIRRVVINGCGEKPGNTLQITVSPEFTPGSITHAGTICKGTPVGMIENGESAGGGFGNYNFRWEKSTNKQTWESINGANAEVYYGTIAAATWFRRIATTPGCNNAASEPVKIEIDPVKAEFAVSHSEVHVGNAVQFICESTNAAQHRWSFSEGEQRTEQSPWVYFNLAGNVTASLLVTSGNNCSSEILKANVVAVNLLTGIDRISPEGISMYPNPATDYFFIGTEKGMIINRVSIFDISGSLVKAENGCREKINVSELPKGIYMLKIELDNRVIVKKLVKQ